MYKDISESIVDTVTESYLNSRDFNGIPLDTLYVPGSAQEKIELLAKLISEEKICITFEEFHPNPHIKALDVPAEHQIELLKSDNHGLGCVYPSSNHLNNVVNKSDYSDRPYFLELKLGAPQLKFKPFDLSVLEFYRNDPRFFYKNDDIRGTIYAKDSFSESGEILDRDSTYLKTFGFCYDENFNRAVAVYIYYLSLLSPEHQTIWKAKELPGKYKLHPDYFRNSILGKFAEKESVFSAFIEELVVINKMCDLMDRPHLFRKDFKKSRPAEFGFLVRPTLKSYNQFVHLLDKMLSDNINKDFFLDEVSDTIETERTDGKIIVQNRGTINMLYDWLNQKFRVNEDEQPIKDMFARFKKLRKIRQNPAHQVSEDKFDQKYFRQQRDLILDTYEAIRLLRLIFANHPSVRESDYEVPSWLFEGKIWNF